MKNLIIFDFDGVIIDSEKTIKKCYIFACNDVLGEGNYPPIEDFLAHTWEALTEIIQWKLRLPKEVEEKYLEYAAKYQNEIVLFSKVKDIIVKLYNSWSIIALVTWKGWKRVGQILKQFELEKYFHQVITSSDIKKSKPDPEGILKVIQTQDIPKDKSIYIWDGTNDVVAAHNAGIQVIWVCWGMNSKQSLIDHSADYIANSPGELEDIINNWKDWKDFNMKSKYYVKYL